MVEARWHGSLNFLHHAARQTNCINQPIQDAACWQSSIFFGRCPWMNTNKRPRHKLKPYVPYWATFFIWALAGPLGAAPASCRRWGRACGEAALSLGGLMLSYDGLAMGHKAYALALASGAASPARAWLAALLLCMSLGLWISDFWNIRRWHGKRADPLLDPPTTLPP